MSDIGFFIQVPRFLLTAHIHSFTSGVLGRRARPFVDTELAHDVSRLLLLSAYVQRSFTPPTQRMYLDYIWDNLIFTSLLVESNHILLLKLWQPTTCRAAPVETHVSLRCLYQVWFCKFLALWFLDIRMVFCHHCFLMVFHLNYFHLNSDRKKFSPDSKYFSMLNWRIFSGILAELKFVFVSVDWLPEKELFIYRF